jgi:hypothetical protein
MVMGVSQQAPQQRRDSQCERQYDCINSGSEGCVPRPCGELVTLYGGADWEGAFFGEFIYEDENYLIGFNTSDAQFGINLNSGASCTMSLGSGTTTGYLASGADDPVEKLRSQVSEDYMFVANRSVVPAMESGTTAAKVNEALVFLRATNQDSNYTISLAGPASLSHTETTGSGSIPGSEALMALFKTAINGVSGYTATQSGSVMKISRGDGAAFTIGTSDDNGDEFLIAFNGEAESFDKLPARGFSGMILKVRGDSKERADDFYVKWTGNSSTGVWEETVGFSTKTSFDATTMPYAWVRTAANTFELRKLTWSTRIVGDVDTAQDPSFIGKNVKDIVYHQQRLGLLNRSGVSFSKAKFPFTFHPDTVQTVLDTAPVDVKVSASDGKGTNNINFAVQVQENLYLWAPKQQHRIGHGTEGFSQKSVETDPSSAYEFSKDVKPLPLGPFLFFTTDVGNYVSFRALQFSGTKLLGDVDMSAHLPSYIKADAAAITGSDTLRILFIRSKLDRQVLYVCNYTHDGQQFVQQAFNTWRLPGGDILWAGVEGNILRVLQQRSEGVAFLKFNLTPNITDTVADEYFTRLDFRVDETDVTGLAYNATTLESSFTLPYEPTDGDTLVIVREDEPSGYSRGRFFEVTNVSGAVINVKGDLTGYKFYVGQRISAERWESEFFVRTDNGSEPFDYLTLNRWTVSLANTIYTRMVVSAPNLPDKEYVFEARDTSSIGSHQLGAPIPRSGDVVADIGQSSKDGRVKLINDSPFPSSWQNAAVEYEGVGWRGRK